MTKLGSCRVPTRVALLRGVPHGFRRFGSKLSASKKWDDMMEEGISWLLSAPSTPTRFEIQEL